MPGPNFEYDVFLSHASENNAFCKKLADLLRNEGFKVWFDHDSHFPSGNLVLSLSANLKRSKKMVAVWSKKYFEKDYTVVEYATQFANDPRGKKNILIPILIEDCEIEEIFRSDRYVDFRGIDINSPAKFKNKLDELIQRLKAKPQDQEDKVINFPFVVYAMTSEEAGTLRDRIASEDRKNFKDLKTKLNKVNKLDKLFRLYGKSRDDWRPAIADLRGPKQRGSRNNNTIKRAIEEIVEQFNQAPKNQKRLNDHVIRPHFFSDICFARNQQSMNIRNAIWSQLRENGVILIVDALSIFDKELRTKLVTSGLGFEHPSSVISLFPICEDSLHINDFLEEVISSGTPVIFDRFFRYFDAQCELGISDVFNLQRWLVSALPAATKKYGESGGIDATIFDL